MDPKRIQELIKILEDSGLTKLVFKEGDFELHLEKNLSSSQPFSPPPMQHIVQQPQISTSPQEGGLFVKSPMVGTFYSSPSPEQPPFVKVGDRVRENTVVCIIEAMKVMNEVKAGVNGVIAEILAHNAEAVEFGSKLFRILAQ